MKALHSNSGKVVYAIGLLLLMMAACNQSIQTPHSLSDEDRDALLLIAEQDSAIVMTRNWDLLESQYSVDAVRMPPNMPTIKGRTAIRTFLDQYPPITKFNFHLVDLQGDGELAYMRATYNITFTLPDSTAASDTGKILVVLKKQPDGSWVRVADAWNSDLAPAK